MSKSRKKKGVPATKQHPSLNVKATRSFSGLKSWRLGALVVVTLVIAGYFFLSRNIDRPIPEQGHITGQADHSDKPNVLLVTIDTMRADKIGAYGYQLARTPWFDYLSKKAVLFQNTFSPVPMTLPAHASIMTGMYPFAHNVRTNSNYQLADRMTTLPEILQNNNYRTAAFVSSFTVDSRFGLDQGFESYSDELDDTHGVVKQFFSERKAEKVFASFAAWFHNSFETPFFIWLHFFDPHAPYNPPQPFKIMFDQDEYANDAQRHYDGEVSYSDSYLEKAFRLLHQKNVLHKTLLIVTGDHGEGFGLHKEIGHQIFCYQENLHVPLLIIFPAGQFKPFLVAQQTSLIDIMPTVLEFLSLGSTSTTQGISLFPLIRQDAAPFREHIYFESHYAFENLACAPLSGIMDGQLKYIHLPRAELYNLEQDPDELNNVYHEENDIVPAFRSLLSDYQQSVQSDPEDSRRELTADEKRNLEALGYISLAAKDDPTSSDQDPKDRIDGYNKFLKALEASIKQDYDAAETYLREALALLPDFKQIYFQLAELYEITNNREKALQMLDLTRTKFPDDFKGALMVAKVYLALGKYDDALAILREAELRDMVEFRGMTNYLLAETHLNLGHNELALTYFQRVYDQEPENIELTARMAEVYRQLGNLNKALQLYQGLYKKMPGDIQIIYNLAVIYAGLKDFSNANRHFQEAIVTDPQPYMHFDYAYFLAENGRFAEAIASMQKYLDISRPEDNQRQVAHNFLAQLKARFGR